MTKQYDPKLIEAEIRKFWEENDIPRRALSRRERKFYLLDGPPYVNAVPHVGHLMTTTYKDVWGKFKLLQGFASWFQPGFDCHGLPIENMVERELGIRSKREIEEIGVEKFIELCRSKAHGNEQVWLEIYRKLGAWRGYFRPYLTDENYYVESAWWAIKEMWKKGMLYKGSKAVYWCPHCETTLAGYEVTDSYAEIEDPYIYVKFPLKDRENEFLVVATTTPWTLVSNVAIAAHPDADYVRVKVGNEILVISESRVEEVLGEVGVEGEILERVKGKELEGLRYRPVIDVPVQHELEEDPKAHRIVLSIPVLKAKAYKHALEEESGKEALVEDFVDPNEGSGLVHVAPGHGPEDNYLGEHYGLPIVSPVDESGEFTSGAGRYGGMRVREASEAIVEELRSKGLLLHERRVRHSYPLCWRCKTPLIFRLSEQWFISIKPIKEEMLRACEDVRWLPEFGRERFRNWLLQAGDWCISRQRYWGIPLPIWVCKRCGRIEVIGSVKELLEKAIEAPKELDLHKHVVDKIKLRCPCGWAMERVPDILDVWFDSGIAPWASLGYPYKNKELFEKLFPVDLIDESQDQIRGWFYSLMFCSMAALGRAPYSAVAMNGWVLDERGEKMSKSLGNVIWAEDALNELGADVVRLYYCYEAAPWETKRFSLRSASELKKKLNVIWNTLNFYETYCDVEPRPDELKVEDRYLLSKLQRLISEVTFHLENFEFHRAGRKLVEFAVEDLSRFYVKLIRDRVWITRRDSGKASALWVLREALLTLSKLLAPITPFLSEAIYRRLEGDSRSVFESDWPRANEGFVDRELEHSIDLVRELGEVVRAMRQRAGVKLRWPLRRLVIQGEDERLAKLRVGKEILKSLVNVQEITLEREKPRGVSEYLQESFDGLNLYLDVTLDEGLRREAILRELMRAVQAARKERGLSVEQKIVLYLRTATEFADFIQKNLNRLLDEVGATRVEFVTKRLEREVECLGTKVEFDFVLE